MSLTERMIEIAKSLEAESLVQDLMAINAREKQENADLILPLVGEFSAGKTTLINALTDSKKLETATKPTTATIYEVHFGEEKCCATVYGADCSTKEVENIADLKNDELADAKVVRVSDTSNRVPKSVVLIDTPGLSSSDPRHKQALVDFLPNADAVLLVVDVNAQITRSLTEFIETMNMAHRPIFLVITQCDTKSESEVQKVREYISKNCKLPVEQTACVAAPKGILTELDTVFAKIQKDKNAILKAVNAQRLKSIAAELINRADQQLKAMKGDKELDEAIYDLKEELDRLNRNISNLISSMKTDIDEANDSICRRFESEVFSKLDTIAATRSAGMDNEVISAVNSTSSLMLNDFKNSILSILSTNAQKRVGTDGEINLQSLKTIDLSGLQIGALGVNLGLENVGHENDGTIGKVALGIAAVGVAVAALPAAAAAASAAGATAADAVMLGGSAAGDLIAAKKFSDVNNQMNRMQMLAQNAQQNMDSFAQQNMEIGQKFGSDRGIIESVVGSVKEFFGSAKPARQRAVRNYIDGQLMPEFKSRMGSMSSGLVQTISDMLNAEANDSITEKRNALENLKQKAKEQQGLIDARKKELEAYKVELMNV